jgi:hypothetical protein
MSINPIDLSKLAFKLKGIATPKIDSQHKILLAKEFGSPQQNATSQKELEVFASPESPIHCPITRGIKDHKKSILPFFDG